MLAPVLVAVGVWWASTGAILLLARQRAVSPRLLVWGLAPGALAAGWGIVALADQPGPAAAYWGFAAAIAVWGWHELAFLTGVVMGPNRRACPPGLPPLARFWQATLTLAWHELALAATLLALVAATWGGAHAWGAVAFAVLFAARISAKLNVFLGVPHLAHDLVPPPLRHLPSYFGQGAMNLLFPVSITVGTLAVAGFAALAWARQDDATGPALVAALAALAVIEHWFLVLPVRDQALWSWMIRERGAMPLVPGPVE